MAKTKTGRPPKDDAAKRQHYLQVRVTKEESDIFDAAANTAGMEKSTWVRNRLLTVARKELRDAGK